MLGFAPTLIILAFAGGASPAKPTPLPTPPPALMKTHMPSFTANDSRITVKAGDPFQIRLKVNTGTGYSWQPQGPLAPGLTLLGVFQTPSGKMQAGGPGEQVLVFRAADAGALTLTLGYMRPWERDVKPAKLHAFKITVNK